MSVNTYKVVVELEIDAASLIDASKLADKICHDIYKLYQIDAHVTKVTR